MSARPHVDYALYLVADPSLVGPRGLRATVTAAVAGGVTVVQLRDKESSAAAMIDAARELRALLAPLGVPLIINDRVDVAVEAGADGVHVGQDDLPACEARRLVGDGKIVGLSITDASQLAAVDPAAVDYLGVGPIFATPSKADAAPPMGLEALAQVCDRVTIPVIGIGGIDATNAARVIGAGAAGVAVISAICSAPDIERAARSLRGAVHEAFARRASGRTSEPAIGQTP